VSDKTFRVKLGKHLLITGGAGFLGANLCETLLDMDCNIYITFPPKERKHCRVLYKEKFTTIMG